MGQIKLEGRGAVKKTILMVFLVGVLIIVLAACANFDYARTEDYVITPKDAIKLMNEGAIVVDVQSAEK